ncbi:hypothetical protein [Persicitalea jodogahamensis]|uniref:hypothetical protein n=1 Tax=Persicitalea jodogahamensis TaxID=402147 RepID=UPI00167A484A|nr:hypothetical protein [Persicitalea jodogahamensis]
MKRLKTSIFPFLLLAFVVFLSSCSYSSYPARPHYGHTNGYGHPHRYGYVRPPRVVVVRPAPRIVYRNSAPRGKARVRRGYSGRSYAGRGNGRSNRNYGSRGPR